MPLVPSGTALIPSPLRSALCKRKWDKLLARNHPFQSSCKITTVKHRTALGSQVPMPRLSLPLMPRATTTAHVGDATLVSSLVPPRPRAADSPLSRKAAASGSGTWEKPRDTGPKAVISNSGISDSAVESAPRLKGWGN